MINVWDYQEAKKIRLIDVDGEEFIGYVVDVTDAEEGADEPYPDDAITISIAGRHIEFMQSEIIFIEILG